MFARNTYAAFQERLNEAGLRLDSEGLPAMRVARKGTKCLDWTQTSARCVVLHQLVMYGLEIS